MIPQPPANNTPLAATLVLIVYKGLPSPDTHSEIPPAARSICTLQLRAAGSQGPPGELGSRPPLKVRYVELQLEVLNVGGVRGANRDETI